MNLTLREILREANAKEASDVHICCDRPVILRVDGEMIDMNDEPLTEREVENIAQELFDEEAREELMRAGEVDFARSIEGYARLRVNIYKECRRMAIALRLLPFDIPEAEELGTPKAVVSASERNKGLILVTGPTGHGKSTTLAAVINHINTKFRKHIITLEDPIEYIHPHKQSVIHQREIGHDTQSFAAGLRAALREDPDVILVGEMRDLETIQTAITAAETGHLVLATLHTNNAAATIDRIIDAFPAEQQQQIRIQLANVLECVVCQSLVPTLAGKRTAVYEVMVSVPAIRNLIRENKTYQITSSLQIGKRQGMQTMDDHLLELYRAKIITRETAVLYAIDPGTLEKKMAM
jgi:twitching motility protein PilT